FFFFFFGVFFVLVFGWWCCCVWWVWFWGVMCWCCRWWWWVGWCWGGCLWLFLGRAGSWWWGFLWGWLLWVFWVWFLGGVFGLGVVVWGGLWVGVGFGLGFGGVLALVGVVVVRVALLFVSRLVAVCGVILARIVCVQWFGVSGLL
ncbi:hypothetical protein, partial [Pseudomonas syringae group genomosp. 7]|uniref:hypothetical protein n=1 Tax=Pseudomonas syringae group genomosp. 7 TaxID=251699 RepID=UPI00376FC3A1